MKPVDQEAAYHEAYPDELAAAEKELVTASRQGRDRAADFRIRDCTGIALSGGGIRSATFSLGIFQGLATLKLLPRLDYLSTVSGGGYFGSFYTRFFMRKEAPDFDYVQQTLAQHCPCGSHKGKDRYQRNIITWLRENGRYLAPMGAGDFLLAGAVMLRNWLVVQVVLAISFLTLFLSIQLLRIYVDPWFHQLAFLKEPGTELVLNLPGELKFWVTPLVLVPLVLFVFGAVPLGWAYWLVGRQPAVATPADLVARPWVGVLFVLCVAPVIFLVLPDHRTLSTGIFLTTVIVAAFTLFWSNFVESAAERSPEGEDPATDPKYREAFKDDLARNTVSVQLKAALVLTGAALAFTFVDSLGQTIYLVLLTPGSALVSWGGGFLAFILALVPFANRITISLRNSNSRQRPAWLSKVAAAAAASILVLTLFTMYGVVANAIAWTMQRPADAPTDIGKKPSPRLSDAGIVQAPDQPNHWSLEPPEQQQDPGIAGKRDTHLLLGSWGICLILSYLFGRSWPFLNRSTHLPMYSARLIRAYLGASNPRRTMDDTAERYGGAEITRVIPGDDIDIEYYWPWPPPPGEYNDDLEKAQEVMYRKGPPLHLVNVTINETLDSKSQVQQQDRKGIGMALGPAAISAGRKHHVVFDRESHEAKVFPLEGFKMFNYAKKEGGHDFTGDRLPLGQWLSISGAAFSTGLGARTNLALSLLTGIGNIRLGYWWDSGVMPETRPKTQKPRPSQFFGTKFTKLFPMQSYLLDEYTARYHGPARRHWYLSDGGHFENMGGYELVRRRLRLILIIDAEADPEYSFGGLADLIRKSRIDFGAEIRFLDDQELDGILPEGHCFSRLENLRRGKWIEEKLPVMSRAERKRRLIDPVDYARFSLAHAAIATVTYDCKEFPESCLIYVKPTLLGTEPLDVLQYHVANPSFPQQPTMDQFFDEAQWESYRRLGEQIAKEVFKAPDGETPDQWLDSLVGRVLQQKSRQAGETSTCAL
jgi:hypothetical protein